MNIFVLDDDPVIAARMLRWGHVNKMILESAQMLCSAFPDGSMPYRRAYYNHPCTKWVRESLQNFEWLYKHATELGSLFAVKQGKIHKSIAVIDYAHENRHLISYPKSCLTPFATAMPDFCKVNGDPVSSYRHYYKSCKQHIKHTDYVGHIQWEAI